MATVTLLPHRRWCGWYNAPGSYEIASKYSALAMADIFDGIFPGGERDPAKILMVDGQVGSKYIPVHSPVADLPRIGHLGDLLERKVDQVQMKKIFPRDGGRHTMDACVTFIKLRQEPDEFKELKPIPSSSIAFLVVTVLFSVGGCVACALVVDWFCLANIALGIIANGVACAVIGSGKLYLKHNIPAQVKSPGDVVLKGDTGIVILLGSEGAVSPITRARFVLQYKGSPEFQPEQETNSNAGNQGQSQSGPNHASPMDNQLRTSSFWSRIPQKYLVRVSVTLLLSQFLVQLLLIPQGTLFGQLMFIATLIPSWMYHSYLSSLSLDFQTKTLFGELRLKEEDIHRYQLNTWTEAAVFACIVLALARRADTSNPIPEGFDEGLRKSIERLLDRMLPSKTDVWQIWKRSLTTKIVQLGPRNDRMPSQFYSEDEMNSGEATGDNQKQLKMYQKDANRALEAWKTIQGNKEILDLIGTAGHS